MDTLQERSRTQLPDAQPARRRRWPFILFGALVVSLIVAGSYVANYQPLEMGSSFAPGPDYLATNVEPSYVETTTIPLKYRDRATTSFGLTIRNRGPWGVTVTGVEPSSGSLLDVAGGRLNPDPSAVSAELSETEDFYPFSLGTGQERLIVVVARFGNCENYLSPGGTTTMVQVFVRYRVLGISHTAHIDLRRGLVVETPPDSDCPGRAG